MTQQFDRISVSRLIILMGILGLLFVLSGCQGDKSAQFSRLQ
ncbi:MAG: hypothetical protein WAL98_14280 [Desulfatiglandaceae bacterium]